MLQIVGQLGLAGTANLRPGFGDKDASGSRVPDTAQSGHWQAAIVGAPRWHDPEFADAARNKGHAAALLAAHARLGDGVLDAVGGNFALAIIDCDSGDGLLAVDRFGARPLCYGKAAVGGIAFASDADAVADMTTAGREIDSQAIYNYIFFHMVPSPGTVYKEVSKLEPGQCLRWANGAVTLDQYWQPTFVESGNTGMNDLAKELPASLDRAVRRCHPATDTGAFLSGGLDSSTVAGMAARACDGPFDAYSIGFSADGYDEMDYARLAAKHFGIKLHEYYVTPEDIVSAIPEISNAYDEPFGNSSAVPALVCARLAKSDGKRAMLAGDGGDEFFAGNERYAKQQVFAHYNRLPAWLRRRIVEPAVSLPLSNWTLPTRKLRSYVEQARVPMPARLQTYNFLQRESATDIFATDFLASIQSSAPLDNMRARYDAAPCDTMLHRMLYLDWKMTLADNDLRKVNRMCELAGVDVYYPMLDDDLVDLSTRVPPTLKLKGKNLRRFYKYALRDFLPTEIINKEKHGFGLPFGVWLKSHNELAELVYSSLEDLKTRRIFAESFIDELVKTHRGGHASYYGNMLWVLMMLERWLAAHAPGWRSG